MCYLHFNYKTLLQTSHYLLEDFWISEKGLEYLRLVIAQPKAPNQILLRVLECLLKERSAALLIILRLSSFTMDHGLAVQFVVPVPGLCK